jgi:hypothetical protein
VIWQQRYYHLQRWRLEGLDKDPHEFFFDLGAHTSSDFV